MPDKCLLSLSCKVVEGGFFGKMSEARLMTLGHDALYPILLREVG